MASNAHAVRVSDEAVAAKTGRNWGEWFAVLDRAGADQLEHKRIATFLHDRHKVPAWWCQMVTVAYEQARGKRQVHERPDGWEMSVSKTIGVEVGRIYQAWVDEKTRKKWLTSEFEMTTATKNKSIRIKWNERERVEVMFYPKGKGKTQMTVTHRRLDEEKAVGQMKEWWKEAVERLQGMMKA